MASFPNVQRAVSRPVATGHALLLADSSKRAAHSNAAVDAAVAACLELATLQRSVPTSALPQPGTVVA